MALNRPPFIHAGQAEEEELSLLVRIIRTATAVVEEGV